MDVAFNNVREIAIAAFTSLCNKLNKAIDDGEIRISADHIQRDMDDLRMAIGTIGLVYDKSRPGEFDVVYDPSKKRMPDFNDNE